MDNDTKGAEQNKIIIDIDSLAHIAIYLSGLKDGKGDLLPLGTIELENLWHCIKYLRGDSRFISKRDEK